MGREEQTVWMEKGKVVMRKMVVENTVLRMD
jgi:hypothetical protein